jgi:hypothetical protein
MRAIDKFILHVVYNWRNKLNEAYSERIMNDFIRKFSEEADDLNLSISEPQLKKYIERFDILKNSPKITEKDLNKYTIGQLIRLVTASPGAETPDDEEDQTPDVVYQDNGVTIWNGSKEGNCINYGSGEKWCITRGSYGSYRYDSNKGYPTFYLAKNSNLSDSDALSFVAIQVRDVYDENKKYVYTNRHNRPYESSPMSFSRLMSEIPWLNNIPDIRSILKYIKLSGQEKASNVYQREAISIREWIKLPFNVKKQYLVARKNAGSLFPDVTNDVFVSDYLPKYPQIAEFVAISPGIVKPELLLRNLNKFSNQDRRSVTANLHDKIDIKHLSSELFPFDVKKLLVILNKWNIPSNERLYITKDGSTIVKLKFSDSVSVSLYTADDDYPNVKLNQRTAKYLLEYPELDKLPFNSLLKLATDGVINKEFVNKVVEKAKSEENSAIIVKKVEDGEILIDANSFSSYKIKDGSITKIPFASEEVQKVLGDEKDNTAFQQSVINIIRDTTNDYDNLPQTIDKDAFVSIINSTPYDKRTISTSNTRGQNVILVPDGESRFTLFIRNTSDEDLYGFYTEQAYGNGGDWGGRSSSEWMDEGAWRSYFAYLRNKNKIYEGRRLQQWFSRGTANTECRKNWFTAQPPISPTDQYALAVTNNQYFVINKANPRESLRLSDSGKLVKANIPSSVARQLLGATPDEATPIAAAAQGAQPPVAAIGRRGRPAGVPNAPRAAVPAAQAATGDINVPEVMDETGLETAFNLLPRLDRRRLSVTTGVRVTPGNDRGASRRNNILGAAGRVGRVIGVGASKIYIIRLANQQVIASINMQPGNRNYILLPDGNMVPLASPAQLLMALQRRNLAEVRSYMVREYIANNPHHLDEVKSLLKKHIAETRKY